MRADRSRRTKAPCSASFANLEFAQGALANPTSGTEPCTKCPIGDIRENPADVPR